jgi:hypothetical protein
LVRLAVLILQTLVDTVLAVAVLVNKEIQQQAQTINTTALVVTVCGLVIGTYLVLAEMVILLAEAEAVVKITLVAHLKLFLL